MRILLCALAFSIASVPAYAKPLRCYYDADGNSKGADSGNPDGHPIGVSIATDEGWVYLLGDGEWENGNSCPATKPG